MNILRKVSKAIVRVEIFVAAVLMFTILALILTNIFSRSIGRPIFWINEVAVLAMIWMTFIGASTAIHFKSAVAVTMFIDSVTPALALWISRAINLIIILFFVFLLWICWIWFQPIEIMSVGFDRRQFSRATANFIYSERLVTVNFQKFWFWLIIPIFSITSLIHSLSNLLSYTHPVAADPANTGHSS